MKNKYEALLKKSESVKIKKGSKSYLKAIVTAIMTFNKLKQDVINTKLERRDDQLQFYDKFLRIYSQVALAWIRKAIRKPLLTLYQDTE